jgi:hypothetical protein
VLLSHSPSPLAYTPTNTCISNGVKREEERVSGCSCRREASHMAPVRLSPSCQSFPEIEKTWKTLIYWGRFVLVQTPNLLGSTSRFSNLYISPRRRPAYRSWCVFSWSTCCMRTFRCSSFTHCPLFFFH